MFHREYVREEPKDNLFLSFYQISRDEFLGYSVRADIQRKTTYNACITGIVRLLLLTTHPPNYSFYANSHLKQTGSFHRACKAAFAAAF